MGLILTRLRQALPPTLILLAAYAAGTLSLVQVAAAQDQAGPETSPPTTPPPDAGELPNDRQIVVIGNRAIIASLEDVPVEQTYDADRAQSYGVTSIGEVLDAIGEENGDEDPALLVNGRPINDRSEVSDFPVEAISRIEALPRGSASRVGGPPGQRAYNVVLRPALKQLTLTASYEAATEGGWHELRGEGTVTYIKGRDRLNFTARARGSDDLLHSDRAIIPTPQSYPYSALGNVVPLSGAEIDPALSLVAGMVLAEAGVPAGVTNPSLAQFAAAPLNPNFYSQFRSLRGEARNYEAGLSGNKSFADWLSLSFSARLGWTRDERLNGLPNARALVPTSNAFSPFTQSVVVAINDPARPLVNRSRSNTVNISSTLNATFGDWRATLGFKYDERDRDYAYQLTDTIPGGFLTVPDATNPFTGGLGAQIPLTTRITTSRTTTRDLQADAEGPLFNLPAGPVRLRLGAGATWLSLSGSSSQAAALPDFSRHEYEGRGGLSIPLTSAAQGPLLGLGDLEFTVDAAKADLGPFGSVDSLSLGLNWQVSPWLRIAVSQQNAERAPSPELLKAPSLVTENVPYFDPQTGETVDITLVTGGAGDLTNERQRIRTVSVSATPWRKYNLRLNADFVVTDLFNQFGGLPSPTPAVVAAFPDRFVRDGQGKLIQVDSRTVNFDRQHTSELRTGLAFTIPFYKAPSPGQTTARTADAKVSRARPTLQVNVSHTHLFSNTSTIREALGPVDLLAGGAIGLGGGRQRDTINASVTFSDRGTGVRANLRWYGPSNLATGTLAAPDRLRFESYARFDLKAYADLGNLLGRKGLAKGTKITLTVENLFNQRQRVFDSAGLTPLSYQPAYRDAIGRTVMIELRKVF